MTEPDLPGPAPIDLSSPEYDPVDDEMEMRDLWRERRGEEFRLL